jgi:alkylhydroperoxidase/carboxymuconolactone decarboxylase family protein YurZ
MNSTHAPNEPLQTPLTDEMVARGDWNPMWDVLQQWDAGFLEAYLAMRNAPYSRGPLNDKTKELILIAINASTTHLYGPGVRRHIQNALKLGATREEILQVIELTTVLGIHSCFVALPILVEEMNAASSVASP